MKVFLTGATGYVGQVMVGTLQAAGHEVVALERNQTRRALALEGVKRVSGDITVPSTLAGLMDGCDVVIHLVGIIREYPRKGVTMETIHVRGTENIVTCAQQSGVRRFLHMSALGARANAVSSYHRSKWEAEEYVRQSGLDYTIFRPSVLFGRGGPGPNFIAQLAELVTKAPIVPIIGDGQFLLQPVSIHNVVDGFTRALQTPLTVRKEYEVGGPEQIPYIEILRRISAHFGKKLRTVKVPVSLMKVLVPFLQKIPSFPLTNDQLIMLLEQNICTTDWETYYRDLQLEPDKFQVAESLGKNEPGNTY
jgi:uncharacterized protein YbjT (DUF2867 family)